MDLVLIFKINVIDDDVTSAMDVDLMSNPLLSILWNLGSEKVEKYDEVFASLMGLDSYTKNPCKLNLYLKIIEFPPANHCYG